MRIERLDSNVTGQWIKVCLAQLAFSPRLNTTSSEFGWHLTDSDKPIIKQKIFSAFVEIFKECGADGWVEKYEKELAGL